MALLCVGIAVGVATARRVDVDVDVAVVVPFTVVSTSVLLTTVSPI